jgi:hypothetical protein
MFSSPYTNTTDQVVAHASPSLSAPPGGKNFSLDIKVDHPIVLHGIQVPTLCFPVATRRKPLVKEYDESFTVTVLDAFGTTISHTVFVGKFVHGSAVDINLKQPIILQKNVSYEIQVSTKNTYFLKERLRTVEDCPPVKFMFKDKAKANASLFNTGMTQETDCAFVKQLIYSFCV